MSTSRVVLITKRQSPPAGFNGAWMYLGKNYLEQSKWRHRLPPEQEVVYGDLLVESVERLRRPFADWVSKKCEEYGGSLRWSMTALAAHEVFQSDTFLHLCYLDVLDKIPPRHPGPLLVICEDWFLLAAVRRKFKGDAPPAVVFHASAPAACAAILWRAGYGVASLMLNAARFARRWAAARLSGRRHFPQRPQVRQVLIHSCIDEKSFGADGGFKDRYFSGLFEWMEANGCEVTLLAWVSNIKRSQMAAVRWMRGAASRFLIIEDYIRLRDLPWAVWESFSVGMVARGNHTFEGNDITPLVWRERLMDATGFEKVRFFLYRQGLRRWLAAGNRCDIFIDTFEHNRTEKVPLRTFREMSPGTVTVGYSHTLGPPDYLGYVAGVDEYVNGLYPARIVTNGRIGREILLKGNFPPVNVATGPALRVAARPVEQSAGQGGGKTVLVLLPLSYEYSAELVAAMRGASAALAAAGLNIILKNHPMMNRQQLMANIGMKSLPGGWRWTDQEISGCFTDVAAVVSAASGSVIDAVIHRVPPVVLASGYGLSLNYLGHWKEAYRICQSYSAHALRERILEVVADADGRVRAETEALSKILAEGLGPVDDAHLAAFIRFEERPGG